MARVAAAVIDGAASLAGRVIDGAAAIPPKVVKGLRSVSGLVGRIAGRGRKEAAM